MRWPGLLLSLLLLTVPAYGQEDGSRPTCTAEEVDSFLRDLASLAKGELALAVSPAKERYALDDEIRIRLRSSIAGRLTVLSIDSAGEASVIFPNRNFSERDSNRIEAGTGIELPGARAGFKLVTQPPLGPSRLIAIVRPTNRDIPLECAEGLDEGKGFAIVAAAPKPHQVSPKRQVSAAGWAFRELRYVVVE